MPRRRIGFFHLAASLAIFWSIGLAGSAEAQIGGPTAAKPRTGGWFSRRQKPAAELINRQEPPRLYPRVLASATPDSTSILVSLSRQRAYLLSRGEIAVDTPISSGKVAGMTPLGQFKVREKDKNHRSNVYGNFLNAAGEMVRSGVSSRIDSAPSGTHFAGAPMWYFLRLNDEGVGLHVGILPGYAASHGCIRQPPEIAPILFDHVKIGTPVQIVQ